MGWLELWTAVIDWFLRVAGCAALVVIAFFLCWSMDSAGFFLVAAICLAIAIGALIYGFKQGWQL